MQVTFTLHDIGLFLVFACLIVMLIVLTIVLINAISTVKKLNEVLDDAKVVTEVAARRADDLDNIMDNVSDSVGGVANALKGKENLMQSMSSIGKAASSIIGIIKGKGE